MKEVSDLDEQTRAWIDRDPDPETRSELLRLLDEGQIEDLKAAMIPPLEFGTAGLRGPVGPGAARINLAWAARLGWGLGAYVKELGLGDRPVIVGFDARPTSESFAACIVRLLTSQGVPVARFSKPVPTPWVAFCCRSLKAAAGVVVTASHNPRPDNGIKVYDDRGIQIVAPWDAEISDRMARMPRLDHLWASGVPVTDLDEATLEPYFEYLRELRARSADDLEAVGSSTSRPLRVAYTPLHGVGLASIERALGESCDLHVVAEQAVPDGTFPTVAFPNPEEPHVLDRLFDVAREFDCDLALANDPDADRLAVGVVREGAFRQLTGDQVGCLLADFLLAEHFGQRGDVRGVGAGIRGAEGHDFDGGSDVDGDGAPRSEVVVASSIVSSPLLERIAVHYGVRVERTLTGFKWIARVADSLPESTNLLLGYEEALGYCLGSASRGPVVFDKDGIAAAVVVTRLAEHERRAGRTLFERLEVLSRRYGHWVTYPASIRFLQGNALATMNEAVTRLRSAPPTVLGAYEVASSVDYLQGAESRPAFFGAANLLELAVEGANGSGKIYVRPSGTEPKLKFYVHLGCPWSDEEGFSGLDARLHHDATAIVDGLRELLGFAK